MFSQRLIIFSVTFCFWKCEKTQVCHRMENYHPKLHCIGIIKVYWMFDVIFVPLMLGDVAIHSCPISWIIFPIESAAKWFEKMDSILNLSSNLYKSLCISSDSGLQSIYPMEVWSEVPFESLCVQSPFLPSAHTNQHCNTFLTLCVRKVKMFVEVHFITS